MISLFEPKPLEEITNRLNNLTIQHKRQWGKMEVSQMLKHLNLVLGIATGDVVVKSNLLFKIIGPLIKKQVLQPTDFKKDSPTSKDLIITNNSLNFSEEKNSLITTLNKFITQGEAAVDGLRHPVFGKMTANEWGFCQWKHFDHHLKQFNA